MKANFFEIRPIGYLKKAGIPLLKHVGNSPDMNAIEGAWMPMRVAITRDWGPYIH
jgi:hypothetical protein